MNDWGEVLSLFAPRDALQALRLWLRSERQRLRWTQAELARRSGVPAASISRLEQTGLASTEALFKIIFALNRLDAVHDFLKERQRLASLPVSLSDDSPKRPILRVRPRIHPHEEPPR